MYIDCVIAQVIHVFASYIYQTDAVQHEALPPAQEIRVMLQRRQLNDATTDM